MTSKCSFQPKPVHDSVILCHVLTGNVFVNVSEADIMFLHVNLFINFRDLEMNV